VHDDVERLRAEVGYEALRNAVDRAVANLLVALARSERLRNVPIAVERRIEGIDLFEVEEFP